MAQTGVIIVAGGAGNRMGGALPKQFLLLRGKPVLAHTINNFATALPGAEIVVVLPAAYLDFWKNFSARFEISRHKLAEGGAERFHSVRNGIAALDPATEIIAVQDAVRPLASTDLIRRIHADAEVSGAAIPVVEPVDSFRQVTRGLAPADTLDTDSLPHVEDKNSHPIDRRSLRMVQTPQIFDAQILRQAYAADYCAEFTDDASVVEYTGKTIFLSEGERQNLKITTHEDLTLAEALLAARDVQDEDSTPDDDSRHDNPSHQDCGCPHGGCNKHHSAESNMSHEECGDGCCGDRGSCDRGCGCNKNNCEKCHCEKSCGGDQDTPDNSPDNSPADDPYSNSCAYY